MTDASRGAVPLTWLAAAYIGIAAVSHVQNAKTTTSQLERAAKQLDEQNKALTSAKGSELTAFKTYLGAVYDSESLAGQVTVAGKDVEISKEVATQVNSQSEDAQQKYHAALAARNAAESAIENFKKTLIPGEQRDLVPAALKQSLKRAQDQLAQARDDLAKTQNREVAVAETKSSGDKSPSSPSAVQQRHLDLLKMLASAKQEHTRTENEWQTKQRELSTAQSSYAAANTQHEKLKREHDSIQLTLPVLNLQVAPVYFFALAPLFLLVLYWNVVTKDKTITRSLQHVTEQLNTELIDEQAIAQVIPELESAPPSVLGRVQGLLPDLVAVALVGVLAYLGPTLIHLVAIALLLVTVGFRVKSLALQRAEYTTTT